MRRIWHSPIRSILLVAVSALLVDQLTKALAIQFLSDKTTLPLIPHVFHFTLVHNTGIAFGLFDEHRLLLFTLITISIVVLVLLSWSYRNASRLHRVTYGMILGGAIGNWVDRVRFGHVIDFLDFHVWPVFNIADSCITVGVLILITLALISPKHAP